VLASFGLGEECDTPVRLPTNAVARYRVLVRSQKTEDDEWEPDREALECLTEDTTRGRDDALRELLAADLVAPGRRVAVLYGSAGRRR
jgi:hypothetical protein